MSADLYTEFRELRAGDGWRVGARGMIEYYRYQDCADILRDPRWGKGDGLRRSERKGSGFRNSFMRQDPPEHTRLRGLVAKAFSPSVVAALRPRIQQIADDLLDDLKPDTDVDLLSAYAYLLPVTVICELLGVPVEDRDRFGRWSAALARGEDDDEELTEEDRRRRRGASMRFREYFARLIEERRRKPGEDLLSRLIEIRDEGDRLDDPDLQATCVLLLFAGHETTVNLITMGTHALLRHPDQLAIVRSPRAAELSWVDELLRYESPVQIASRAALEDLEHHGRAYRKGDMVLLMLGSANRDEDVFPDPERLDVTRPNVRHIALGLGIHFCLGAPLVRLEGEIAVGTLLRRVPGLALAGDTPTYRSNRSMRGLQQMMVHLGGKV
jgi:cytochrome P450